jgi:hypothetical protein
MSQDAKQCPWCARWCLKDMACNYIFACGLDTSRGFVVGAGCGKSWCFACGKKFCGQHTDPTTGHRMASARDHHDANCCKQESGYVKEDYCSGGHNSHCGPR